MQLAIVIVFAVTCALLSSFDRGQVTAQSGFVSIDCGSDTNYIDAGLTWTSDSQKYGFLEEVSSTANVSLPAANQYQWLSSMRIFEGKQSKYCYVFDHNDGIVEQNPYLIRASFWTGDQLPFSTPSKDQISFKLLINADVWDDIVISLPQKNPLVKEVYVLAQLPSISVCVAGTAFISSLELRPIERTWIAVNQSFPNLSFLYARLDLGSPTDIRFPADTYDRIWSGDTSFDTYSVTITSGTTTISTARSITFGYDENPPSEVLQTALTQNSSFNITFDEISGSYKFIYNLYFAEVLDAVTEPGERVFNDYLTTSSGETLGGYDVNPYSDQVAFRYGGELVPVNAGGFLTFGFERNSTSLYGPLVSALELRYLSQNPMSFGTDKDDIATLKNVMSPFSSLNTWSGDPCLPYAYNWLTCTKDTQPFISTISLSNKSLVGEIPTGFNKFKSLVELSLADNQLSGPIPDLRLAQYLKVLDLHDNNLSGPIPNYLGEMSSLTTLNLENNNFSGQIPSSLLGAAPYLKFSVAGNPFLCGGNNNEEYCKASSPSKKGSGAVVAGVGAVCAIVALIAIGVLVFCIVKKKKKTVVVTNDPSNKQAKTDPQDDHHENVLLHANIRGRSNQADEFTFQAIKTMTRNFERILGQGGFGPVYHGVLQNGKNVAVKLLAKDSHQGEQEFLNEVEVLSRVHHKNLVSFVGYCIESQLVLVYEFLANGSLFEALHGKGAKLVAWRDRLHIAVDAAEGLDYLHRGCNPSIIHRDVKSSNILLNDQFEGKISDFGISKSKQYNNTKEGVSQTFTVVQGSFGYLDPAYAETNIANHSIDVYAFGIVLFELVTGKRPSIQQMTRGGEPQHILTWAKPLIEEGDISRLVDPMISKDFNVSSMWKVIDVAMMCVEHDRKRRPTMTEITHQLKSALSMELQNYDINSLDEQTAYTGYTYITDVRTR